jgi:Response regulator of the LytR/AlgR family
MNIKIDKSDAYDPEPEIVIRCREIDDKVQKILSLLDMREKKLIGFIEQTEYVIDPKEVLYCESVEGIVFIYTEKQVYKSAYILNEIENVFSMAGFFRCSKSIVININSVKSLESEFGNRIDALLSSGEHIIISRHYAKQFRIILKEAGSL